MPTRIQAYNVAGHVFSLEMDAECGVWKQLENYAPFRSSVAAAAPRGEKREETGYGESVKNGEGQVRIFALKVVKRLDLAEVRPLYRGEPAPGATRIEVGTTDAGDLLFELAASASAPVAGRLRTNGSFTQGELLVEDPVYSEFCINNAMMLLYAFRTATLGTLEMHASVIVCEGRGYLFLGTSGTGKSTHSSLWLRHIPGTHLLNDDNPVVHVQGGIPRVYGTPWSGKTPCYRNEDFPVGAFILIRQAPRNVIRKLTVPEAVAVLSASCSGLKSIRSIGDGLFAAIASVIGTVPCYLLECLPDAEAAELCFQTVTGHGK